MKLSTADQRHTIANIRDNYEILFLILLFLYIIFVVKKFPALCVVETSI